MKSLPPPLKWAGGKRWLVPYLQPLWEAFSERRLVEPFCGGLAVSLGLEPRNALVNDINPHLMRFYGWIQQNDHLNPQDWQLDSPITDAIVEEIRTDVPPRSEEYYAARKRLNILISSKQLSLEEESELAQLFYYLNRTCFNGLCRFNSRGEFNVPIGKYKKVAYRGDFSKYKKAFQKWQFKVSDFEDIPLRDSDFLYCDSPYDTPFTKYSQEDFLWKDQKRLAAWSKNHPGPAVLSNQATARMVELYRRAGFRLFYLDAPRRISSNGDRTPAEEILALHNISPYVLATIWPIWQKMGVRSRGPRVDDGSADGSDFSPF